MGIDSWCVIWQLSIENGMSYQVKTTSMYVFWTIWSCHGALEWSVNCTSEYIWWIHYLMEEESLSRSRQLLTENEMSYQSETTSRHVISTIQSCHGTLEQLVNCILKYIWRIHIYWEYTACAWVGNFQLRMECHIKARQHQGISSKPFRATIAPWNSPSTASLNTFEGAIIYWVRQFGAELANVNWVWDVILRQNNVKGCRLNHSEPSWRPGMARKLHLWRHLRDLSSNGGRELVPKLAIVNWEWDII